MSHLRQYDVIAAPTDAGYPYFVVLQSDLLRDLATRVVAPLIDATKVSPLEGLWPKVAVANTAYVVMMPLMQSRRTDAATKPVDNVASEAPAIRQAVALIHSSD